MRFLRLPSLLTATLALTALLSGCGNPSEPQTVSYNGSVIKYSKTFNDLNAKHLEAAAQYGLKEIPQTREDINPDRLKKIETCKTYTVEELTHSVPYLTAGAKGELEAICNLFQARLKENSLPLYRPIVTSVLRTQEDVDKLRKTNVNASANSSHCYGTTFDLACVRFDRVRKRGPVMAESDLKTILAEVLKAEKEAGNVYVKYEVKQNCFHITCLK